MTADRWVDPSDEDATRLDPAEVFAAGERNHHVSNTAYPIAHERTWRPYRVERERHGAVAARAFGGIDDLCLYAHVPFCEVRCAYCEYTVVSGPDLTATDPYMDRLQRELDLWVDLLGSGRTLHGFDIGGGTPAFVDARRIAELVERVHTRFRLAPPSEGRVSPSGYGISIETTPKIAAAEPDKLRAYRAAGIDRVSMGVQVIQPDLLRVLSRDGNGAELHRRAVDHVRAAGFGRLNLDVMYGFASQSLAGVEATIRHTLALEPEYITLYRMRYKLTRISHEAGQVELEAVRAQAALAKQLLRDAGYHATPGKNTFSKVPDDVGTSEYLTRRVVEGMPYLGIGLGAQSFTHQTISYGDGAVGKNLLPYFRSVDAGRLPLQDLYDLPATQMMAKFVAVAFYFGEIDRAAFHAKFGVSVVEAFPAEVAFVLERGLMEHTDRALRLTPEGARHFHGVIALFFAPSVQRYLVARDPIAAEDMHRARGRALAVAGGPTLRVS